jgi:dolichol-phosphate mannosyltransferase
MNHAVAHSDFLIIIPMYNEAAHVHTMVRRLKKAGLLDRAVFIDDGSTDSTHELLTNGNCRVLKQPQNYGVGAALRRGIKYAMRQGVAAVVILAGDAQDDPCEIPTLLSVARRFRAHFVQGSRYKLDPHHRGVTWRGIATRAYSVLFSFVAQKWITDASNGFRFIDLSMVRRLNLLDLPLNRYDFEPLLLLEAIRQKFRVIEAPVHKYYHPTKGYSKMIPFFGWLSILKPIFQVLLNSILFSRKIRS